MQYHKLINKNPYKNVKKIKKMLFKDCALRKKKSIAIANLFRFFHSLNALDIIRILFYILDYQTLHSILQN